MKDAVTLKVKKDRLKIYLDPILEESILKQSLIDKIIEVKTFVGTIKTAVEFVGRDISEKEEDEYLEIIRNNSDMEITYVLSNGELEPKMKTIFDSVKGEGKVKIYKGMVRSGTLLEYDGNIIILGDVNPGGIVKASGSVVVLGYLNGTVYAGLEDGKSAFIGAIYMNPIQLKIGDHIARSSTGQLDNTKKIKENMEFEIAYVNGEDIFIDNYDKKIVEAMLLEND